MTKSENNRSTYLCKRKRNRNLGFPHGCPPIAASELCQPPHANVIPDQVTPDCPIRKIDFLRNDTHRYAPKCLKTLLLRNFPYVGAEWAFSYEVLGLRDALPRSAAMAARSGGGGARRRDADRNEEAYTSPNRKVWDNSRNTETSVWARRGFFPQVVRGKLRGLAVGYAGQVGHDERTKHAEHGY